MKFLIYLPMPNKHRAPILASLARTLQQGGHEVSIICEPKIAFRFGDDPEVHVLDNQTSMHLSFSGTLEECCDEVNSFAGNMEKSLLAAEDNRLHLVPPLIDRFRPDRIIMWSGNFHYQRKMLKWIRDNGYAEKIIFCEVAWFSQKEFIYFDPLGVNSRSSICGKQYAPLGAHQLTKLKQWQDRYRNKHYSEKLPLFSDKRIFVPLQVDTDTSISLSSPFSSMQDFVEFLEGWIPADYEVTFKVHPKATYKYPLGSNRSNFHFMASGGVEGYLAQADIVLGINSTVLLEGLVMGKRVVAFGDGVFTDCGVVEKAGKESDPFVTLNPTIDEESRNSFLYHLVFDRQVCLDELKNKNVAHLFSRFPFNSYESSKTIEQEIFQLNSKEGKSMIKIGKSRIAKSACLDVEKGGTITIGDNCEVRHHAVLEVSGRYNGTITIGDHCVIGIGNWMQGSGRIVIGDDVIIGPYTSIVSTNHKYDNADIPVAKQPLEIGEVIIGNDVWIGANAVIATNVTIGSHSIIGANSFVNKNVPPYSIVAGTPARLIKKRK